jgi:hypothetical protein
LSDHPKPQLDKFKELARELESDEDEAAFEETVRKIATPKGIPQAECIHCGRSFPISEGHVSDEVSLCETCLHRD